jgi:hypothetical protein
VSKIADRTKIAELWNTPTWREEFSVSSGTMEIHLVPRDVGWEDLLQWKIERKSLTRDILYPRARMAVYVDVAKEHQLNTESRGGWSGYLAAFQAFLIGKGYEWAEVCKSADLWNVKHREQIAKFVEGMAGHEDVHEKIELVAKCLRKGDFNPDELPPWAAFRYTDPWNYQNIPMISWWTLRESRATVAGFANGLQPITLTIQDVDYLRQSVKIMIKGNVHFVAGEPSEEGRDVIDTIKQYLGGLATKYAKAMEGLNEDEKITSKRRELTLMCTEAEKEITHAFVTNIPNDLASNFTRWEEDLLRALQQAPVKFNEADVKHAMRFATVHTEDVANSFGIMIPCDKTYTVGSRTFHTHFVLLGPERERLPSEMRRVAQRVNTRYVIHLLDEEEVAQLPRSKVQCVFRGVTYNAAVNQFLRQVVADYLRGKELYGRLTMIHDYRHFVAMGMYTEIIMVVYVMWAPTDMEVKRGHDVMGFEHGAQRMDFRHKGVVLDAYKTLGATDNAYISAAIREEKPHLVFKFVRWTNYEAMIARLLQLVDINVVDYWFVATTLKGEHLETVVGLSTTVEPRTLPVELLREFVELRDGAIRLVMRLPYQSTPSFLIRLVERQGAQKMGPPQPRPSVPRFNPPRPAAAVYTPSNISEGQRVTPRQAWQSSGRATPSDITTVTTLGSKVTELETTIVAAVKESASMVVAIRNQLQEEKQGRERLENKYHELQEEMEHLRQTATANAGSISQVKGTMDTMVQQMVTAQEESRQQFRLLYEALMRKSPDTGAHACDNV